MKVKEIYESERRTYGGAGRKNPKNSMV